MKGWFWAFLILSLCSQVHAEESASLTLEQSLQEAQNHSPYYQKAQSMEKEASWGQLEAWSEGFLPNITVKGQYFLPDPQYGNLNVQFGGPQTINFPGIYPEKTLALDASYDLFDGFKNVHKLDSANNYHHAAQILSDWSLFQLVRQVRLKFYQSLAAKLLSEMADQNVITLENHWKIVKDQLDNGQATKYDVLRVEVQLSEAKSDQLSAHDDEALARDNLTLALGLKKDDRPLSGTLPVLDSDKILASLAQVDFQQRPDLRAKELQTFAAEDASAASSSFWLPKVSLIGEYQFYNSPDYLYNAAVSMNYLSDNNNFRTAYFVGAAASWDLLDFGYYMAKANEADEKAHQSRLDLEAAQLEAPNEFNHWKRKLTSSVALYKAKLTDVDKAKESTRLATVGFKAGTRTTTDVLDAELEQFRAEAGVVQAQLNALEALNNLEMAIGKGIEHD